MEDYPLQRIIFPDEDRKREADLFVRFSKPGRDFASKAGVQQLNSEETVYLDTFFNSFSLKKWKSIASIDKIGVRMCGSGTIRLKVLGYSQVLEKAEVLTKIVELDGQNCLWLDETDTLQRMATLSIEVTAISDATLSTSFWVTNAEPSQNVNIAAVITTFKREEMAKNAIQKFETQIIPDGDSCIGRLYVIDNGRSLEAGSSDSTRIIPNENLGGAGGFTRGLLEAEKSGDFTHVLFMDDDADCDPESVTRTAAVLRYAKDPRAAVSGSMLLSDHRTVQHEKSAIYHLSKGKGSALQHLGNKTNLADVSAVVQNDLNDLGNYGAWWFFCFPLEAVEALPFPFFVRGDDIDFSLSNDFKIVTLNGIATWCEDFWNKSGPKTDYLANRAELAISFLHGDKKLAKTRLKSVIRRAKRAGFAFNYGRMEALIAAIEDVSKGPDFFVENPSAIEFIKDLEPSGKEVEFDDERISRRDLEPPGYRCSLFRQLIRKTTLAGHIRKKTYVEDVAWITDPHAGHLVDTTRYRRTAISDGQSCQLYERDNERFLRNYRSLRHIERRITSQVSRIMELYRASQHNARSREYWGKKLSI